MKSLPFPDELRPKEKTYIIGKEVKAVSVADAIRRERNAPVIEVRETYSKTEDE